MSLRGLQRALAVVGISLTTLRRTPGRTTLAVAAVTCAVLSMTVLASLGIGVVALGEDGLETADRDIWVSGEPVDPAEHGSENPIVGAHELSASLTERDDIAVAAPIVLQEIIIETNDGDREHVPAVGVYTTHDDFDFEAGDGFDTYETLLSEGRPTEPRTEEIVLDHETAATLGVTVGDEIDVGASQASTTTVTVGGLSGYYSQFMGTQTATVPLADLQAMSATTGTDRATFVTARVTDDADPDAVAADLDADYPEYDIRSSDEQATAFLEERPIVLASGVTLVGLSVVGGVVLLSNLFALVAAQRRESLAALRAIGLSRWLLAGLVGVQGLLVALFGGLLAVGLTPLIVWGLNELAASAVGFDSLLQTPLEVYLLGLGLALTVGAVVAVLAGWRAGRYATIDDLE